MRIITADITPIIPITLSFLVGDITIRFGELERIIFTALARVKQKDKGKLNEDQYFLKLIGENKDKTLGQLIEKGIEEFKNHNFKWIDFDKIRELKNQRNFIHDALVRHTNGELRWAASGKRRKHRPLDYSGLILLREAVERTIKEIDDGSMAYKKRKSK